MAIISCEKCGKRYSNTVSACIECGNPTPSFVTVNDISQDGVKNASANVGDSDNVKRAERTEGWDGNYVDYYTLSPEYIIELDDEFVLQNEWALKFEQKRRSINMFQSTFFVMAIGSVWLFIFMMFATILIQNHAIADKVLVGIMIALVASTAIMFILAVAIMLMTGGGT